jgi:hypothetical protein
VAGGYRQRATGARSRSGTRQAIDRRGGRHRQRPGIPATIPGALTAWPHRLRRPSTAGCPNPTGRWLPEPDRPLAGRTRPAAGWTNPTDRWLDEPRHPQAANHRVTARDPPRAPAATSLLDICAASGCSDVHLSRPVPPYPVGIGGIGRIGGIRCTGPRRLQSRGRAGGCTAVRYLDPAPPSRYRIRKPISPGSAMASASSQPNQRTSWLSPAWGAGTSEPTTASR